MRSSSLAPHRSHRSWSGNLTTLIAPLVEWVFQARHEPRKILISVFDLPDFFLGSLLIQWMLCLLILAFGANNVLGES